MASIQQFASPPSNVTITCLCQRHIHTFHLPSPLPSLTFYACHCTSDRRSSGHLYQGALDWPYPPTSITTLPHPRYNEDGTDTLDSPLLDPSNTQKSPSHDLDPTSQLERYDFGPNLQYYYCGTCSTRLYWRYKRPGAGLEVFPAVLPDVFLQREDVRMRYGEQLFLEDSGDGGASGWMRGGRVHVQGSESEVVDIDRAGDLITAAERGEGDGEVKVACHCGGVDFRLRTTGVRYPVHLDVSEGGRLFANTDVGVWAEVPVSALELGEGGEIDNSCALRELVRKGGLGKVVIYDDHQYTATRYFCSGCAANVFFRGWRPGARTPDSPSQLCLAVGLLHSRGARAEDLVSWDAAEDIELPLRGIKICRRNGKY